ncbi:MAG TPA: multiheme c-type cytochrome [Pirellulaceae bacterium]|nr:multiheme c-type cytochrome [Pirellulaceae bacterium]HMO91197.1 multiheme c-type cytochrome [Pirellulaceae bacterium]HMP69033.1 multiheme c-type cytochrome [Pirellulaceae bacterium]
MIKTLFRKQARRRKSRRYTLIALVFSITALSVLRIFPFQASRNSDSATNITTSDAFVLRPTHSSRLWSTISEAPSASTTESEQDLPGIEFLLESILSNQEVWQSEVAKSRSFSAEELSVFRNLPRACLVDLDVMEISPLQEIADGSCEHIDIYPNQQMTYISGADSNDRSNTRVQPETLEQLALHYEQPTSGFESHAFGHTSFQEYGSSQTQVAWSSYNPHATASTASRANNIVPESANHTPPSHGGVDPHAQVFSNNPFPSAVECAQCHQQIFEEWSSSSHAYASISPMFHRFEDTINRLSQGTIGYFCMRCHAPIATTLELRRDQAIFDGPRVFREGVTCIVCHRVKTPYTKANGERRVEPGDIYAPVYGGKGQDGSGAATVAKYKEYFKVKVDPSDKSAGQPMHGRVIEFEELSKSEYCMSCHQVAVQPGIKLEIVWDQYRASPAYREGITCQDCHMGRVPGVNAGYSYGPAAVVDNKVVNPERKHSNHVFYGPGYSIAHPGIFPHNIKADRWKVTDWLEFDWRAGWGTRAFEDAVHAGQIRPYFPPAWQNTDDRMDAREIIDENLKKLLVKKDLRRQVMENGSRIDGPFFTCEPLTGKPLQFNFVVSNTNPGHNMPSGSLGAQPQLWLNVVLIGPDGSRLWESGDLDSYGDLRDQHSTDVLERKVPLDRQLFNLQTKFLTTNVKGTDREMYLPINLDFDQLPFIRPAIQPVTTINHPAFIRMESRSIPPLGARKAKYVVPGNLLQMPGTYRLSFRLRSRAEPIYFMRFVEASPEMIRMMNEWIVDAHARSVIFEVK